MALRTFLIDLVEARLPKEFGFPDLGVDGEVLFNMMVKASIWEEDIILDLRSWFCKQNNFAQGDEILDQFWTFRNFCWDIINKQDKEGMPVWFGKLHSTRLLDQQFGVIQIQLPE